MIVANSGNVTARDEEAYVGWVFPRAASHVDGSSIYLAKGSAALKKDQPDCQSFTMAPGQHHVLNIEHLQGEFPEKQLLPDDSLVISAVVKYRLRLLDITWPSRRSFQYNLPDYLATDSSSLSN